jgi:two-component system, sensor histidine kinase LadS
MSSRSGQPVGVLAVDLDGFKAVNDHYGHLVGDELLIHVAQRLETAVRDNDLVVRYGGDEFIVVLHPPSHAHYAADIAHRILHSLREPITLEHGHLHHISASIGVTAVHHNTSAATAIDQADQACYAAKKHGKDRIAIHNQH